MPTQAVPLYRQDPRHPKSHPQATACAACEVRASALFGALDAAALDTIHVHIAAIELVADQSIYQSGERGAAVFTVRAGVVRFERVTERGDRRIVRLAGRGDLIGQEALLQRPHGDDAVACTTVELCRIPISLVKDLGSSQAPLLHELMLRWQHALENAEAWAAELASGPARRRMLQLLRKLGEHADAEGRIWLPRRDEIGAMLDMTVETASRLVSQLRRERVLELLTPRAARLDATALRLALRQQDAL